MKNMLKHTALLVSLLAGLHLVVSVLVRAGHLDVDNLSTRSIEPLFHFVLTPTTTSILLVLVFSLSVWGILLFLERTKRNTPSPAPSWPPTPRGRMHQKQLSKPRPRPQDRPTITKNRIEIEEEWNILDEEDKEAIRAIVSQGGLWEADIIALLKARGFLHTATVDSLAERVSFVDCDYARYYSILPEYQALLDLLLAKDYAENSL